MTIPTTSGPADAVEYGASPAIRTLKPAERLRAEDADGGGRRTVVNLSGRLRRLERWAPSPRRCPTCREWRSHRVEYVNDPFERPDPDPTPERCSACGWSPDVIRVEYVDDWGSR